MPEGANPVVQKPRMDPVGVLFANAWRRFRARFWALVWIFVVPTILVVAGGLLSDHAAGGTGTGISAMPTLPPAPSAAPLTGAAIGGGILSFIGTILSIVATVAVINALARGTNVMASWRVGWKLFWAALWIGILDAVAVLGGATLFIVPGIILAVTLAFATYTLVVEDKRGMHALTQSRDYVKGFWWAVVGRLVLVGLILLAAIFFISTPAMIFLGPAAGGAIYFVIMVCFTAFSVTYTYEMYENLRRLKAGAPEGWPKANPRFLTFCMTVGVLAAIFLFVATVLGKI